MTIRARTDFAVYNANIKAFNMHINTPLHQAGKGLVSFIVGLLIATVIIAGILFYLNKSKSDFKTPDSTAVSAPQQPEILTPNNHASPTQPFIPDTSAPTVTASETQVMPTASQPVDMGGIEDEGIDEVITNHSQVTQPAEPHKTPDKTIDKTPKKAPSAPNHTHVTPEQILNNGSLEKAQQAAEKQHTDSKVYLQIGSFNNRIDADAQRAKLVMLGINSSVHSAKVNGTTKYRVQTDHLTQNQAKQIKKTLQQHNIDSLTRAAS
jgi:cell division protein FtsN